MKQILAILFSLFVLISCDIDNNDFTEVLVEPLEIHKNGKVRKLSDKETQNIKQWFEYNRDDWSKSVTTYAPKTVIRNNSISINITKNLIIINLKKDNGNWIQMTKSVHTKTTIRL